MALLKLAHLKNKYDLTITKIAHVGAHKGQEVEEYLELLTKEQVTTIIMKYGVDDKKLKKIYKKAWLVYDFIRIFRYRNRRSIWSQIVKLIMK